MVEYSDMSNVIHCPNCGESIEVTQALASQVEKSVSEQHRQELERVKAETASVIRKNIEEKNRLERADLQKQLEEQQKKVRDFLQHELQLREEKRKLEESKQEIELSITRRLDEERKKIEEATAKRLSEETRLRELEKDKVIQSLRQSLEEAQRKAQQGSQQLQGEVQELDLEKQLREAFPQDSIEPVGKGVRGADIQQVVRSPRGVVCGVILWESKRTKAWTDEWLFKLKDDLRATKAHIPVIVTSVLPKDFSSDIGLKDGVWITTFPLALALGTLLRKNLLDVAYQKAVLAHQGEKADILYEYITGHEFRQQVEALVEVSRDMHEQIAKERAAFEKSWKVRETQIQRLFSSTARIYGSMQGVIGSSLPQVRGLELEADDVSVEKSSLPLTE